MSEWILIVMVGLPRSGKTTLAQQKGYPIVNPDSIRLALHGQRFCGPAEPFVWAIAYCMVEALFRAGHDRVIVDATNVSEKRRKVWADLAVRIGARMELHIVDTPPEECKRRALEFNDQEIVPVIDRMAAEWDLPRPTSGG